MLAQWSRKRWLVFHLVNTALTSTGAQSYSVGPGGDFDMPRPDRLGAAYIRRLISGASNPVDFPLELQAARAGAASG